MHMVFFSASLFLRFRVLYFFDDILLFYGRTKKELKCKRFEFIIKRYHIMCVPLAEKVLQHNFIRKF